jgi:hypothetical protein
MAVEGRRDVSLQRAQYLRLEGGGERSAGAGRGAVGFGEVMMIERKLIEAGVKNLRAYGYPECDKDNILTDRIYSAFFASMLKDNKGKAGDAVDAVIDSLLAKADA